MTTTALLIEHLLAGIQAGLALVLLVFTFVDPVPVLALWQTSEAVAGVVALALAYPLGVFVDNLAEALLDRWKIKAAERTSDETTVFEIMAPRSSEFLRTVFDGHRTRIRVCRAAVVNFVLLTLGSASFAWSRGEPQLALAAAVLGALLVPLSLWSFYRTTSTWKRWRDRAVAVLSANPALP